MTQDRANPAAPTITPNQEAEPPWPVFVSRCCQAGTTDCPPVFGRMYDPDPICDQCGAPSELIEMDPPEPEPEPEPKRDREIKLTIGDPYDREHRCADIEYGLFATIDGVDHGEIGTVTAVKMRTRGRSGARRWIISEYRVDFCGATFGLGDVAPLHSWAFHSDTFASVLTAYVNGPRGHAAAKRELKDDVETLLAYYLDDVTTDDTEPKEGNMGTDDSGREEALDLMRGMLSSMAIYEPQRARLKQCTEAAQRCADEVARAAEQALALADGELFSAGSDREVVDLMVSLIRGPVERCREARAELEKVRAEIDGTMPF